MVNVILMGIQWIIVVVLAALIISKDRELDVLSDKYWKAQKEVKAARETTVDLIASINALKTEKDNYKRLCSSSDAARRNVMAKGGVIACCDCKHLVELSNGSYICAAAGGMSHIDDPQSCFCALAAEGKPND